MGQPPAVVIIARHGARLDAANKQWHLTSPTPYDPPLTYGGWTQSQALGVRIASLLEAREKLHDHHIPKGHVRRPSSASEDGSEGEKEHHHHRSRAHGSKRRRQRAIIHTSPFLRCIQTSIAIGAGIEQYQGSNDQALSADVESATHSKTHVMHSGSPHLHGIDHGTTHHLSAIIEPDDDSDELDDFGRLKKKSQVRKRITSKPELRIDAFLGEWLSPDYYESITPPPSSVMMIASAKADLSYHGESMEALKESTRSSSTHGNFPGGWGNDGSTIGASHDSEEEKAPLSKMSSLAQALSNRDRANSHSSAISTFSRPSQRSLIRTYIPTSHVHRGYVAPVPKYAISPSDPIPAGYVAHARDACVDINYQWDSMRSPHNWGDGGEYGEEWSSMHKRFRKGLHDMVMWYSDHGFSGAMDSRNGVSEPRGEHHEDDAEDTDIILILVTHGAGCNALIGALTNQPVLLDVGMASLTMAVRKDTSTQVSTSSHSSPTEARISDEYDICLTASTEHLRPGSSSSSTAPAQPSPRISSQHSSTYRHRLGSATMLIPTSSPIDGGFSLPEPSARAMAGVNVGGDLQRRGSSASTSSTGLWSKPSAESINSMEEKLDPAGTMPENKKLALKTDQNTIAAVNSTSGLSPFQETPARTLSQRRLWGTSPQVIAIEREQGVKRRWTVNENR